jgi:hypothetical protein
MSYYGSDQPLHASRPVPSYVGLYIGLYKFHPCFSVLNRSSLLQRYSAPNVTVEWLAFLPHIRNVPASNITLETGYQDILCGFLQLLQINAGIVIIIGSTALRGPWPSLEASASFHPAAAASYYFATRVFSRVGLLATRPTPGYPEGPIFSARVAPLSWIVPILKRQELASRPWMT